MPCFNSWIEILTIANDNNNFIIKRYNLGGKSKSLKLNLLEKIVPKKKPITVKNKETCIANKDDP